MHSDEQDASSSDGDLTLALYDGGTGLRGEARDEWLRVNVAAG